MAGRKGATSTRDPILRRAKIKQAMELVVTKGLPVQDVANLMNVGRKTIHNWKNEAIATGVIDEIRDRMEREQLPKALRVYDTILDADVDEVTDKRTVKAHELKLKAARDMMQGLGALRKDSTQVKIKQTLDLEGYAELRAARNVLAPKRADALLPAVEGQLVGVDTHYQESVVTPQEPHGTDRQYRLQTQGPEVRGQADWRGLLPSHDSHDAGEVLDRGDRTGRDARSQEGGREDLPGEGTDDDPEVDGDGDGEV